MSERKVVAVVGATGSQGGGLVSALLADRGGEFAVRALTRDAGSVRAKELAARGAEVVAADLDDVASVRRAFEGAHGAFVVTNYWQRRAPEQEHARTAAEMELAQAENAARAAGEAGVRHVIWSTLEDTRPFFGVDGKRVPTVDGGRYTVPHFDAKAEADQFFRDRGVPTTFLRTTFFFEGFTSFLAPRRDEHGALVLAAPMGEARVAGIASEDIGKTALGIFHREELIGETISIAGDHRTGAEYATALGDALGEPVTYQAVPFEHMREFSVEMANMMQFYAENERQFVGDRDLGAVRALNPELQSFDTWIAANKNAIPGI